MPGVTVLSSSPAIGSGITLPQKLPPMQNGASSHRASVTEIKDAAKEQARKVGRGASAISLLNSARSQILTGQEQDMKGDWRSALSCYTKAAVLTKMFMDHTEFKSEKQPGKMGVLVKEFLDFQKREGHDLASKLQRVEEKLEQESSPQRVEASEPDEEPAQRVGNSIADRMRALQSAGLSLQPSAKRISRDLTSSTVVPEMPISPLSPTKWAAPSSPLAGHPSLLTSFPSGVAAAASPHALVPTSSLGPPSPSSSTSSSPHASHFSLTEFASQFPSIDELEETDVLKLPSVPTGSSRSSDKPSNSDLRSSVQQRPILAAPRPFPVLPLDPGPRPSSTPIPPTIDTFMSRPGTPSRSPALPPSVPRKPSGLSLGGRSPVLSQSTGQSVDKAEKTDAPISTLFPKILMELKSRSNYRVLVLDVRNRLEFEREHIKADAVVCLEPSVLMRDGINARSIEDSLTVAPGPEWTLFNNRDKFDLVAIYDDNSETLGLPNSPLSILTREIYELAFTKFLKQPPMILVGGLQAWKREFGDCEVVKGGIPPLSFSNGSAIPALPNGNALVSTPVTNGITNGIVLNGIPNGVSIGMSSTSGHTRLPAETFTSGGPPSSASDLVTLSPGRQRSGTVPSLVQDHFSHRPWIPPASAQDSAPSSPRPQRRAAITRPPSSSVSYPHTSTIPEHSTPPYTPPLVNGTTPIQYPAFPRHISPQVSGSSFSSPGLNGLVSMPPQASINPSPLSRRRSDYVDPSQEALNGLTKRPSIDYPDLSSHNLIRPPPVAASSFSERQDNRPRIVPPSYTLPTIPKAPTIQSDYPVTYWPDIQIGTSGLKNLGNTCYMNSTIQCLSATVPFARFFTDGRWKSAVNMVNPLGTKGNLAHAFANILRDMWQAESQILSPVTFRRSICMYAAQFSGTEQHDSQEFLSFLLDGLHEDLNRVLNKPQLESTPEREAELERLPVQIASEQEWQIYRMRNDSLVVDFFQGQFRNRMECLTCNKTSTTYNTFMYLTLPIPTTRGEKVTLQHCLDAFVKEEVMEKSDAWHCPHCKELRKATKRLSLSRLPPVLLIHLKRFSVKGPFTDKVDTFIDFPTRGLDLTNYMSPPLPPGISSGSPVSPDDPRSQVPPYRYDLYGVTNHFGTLSTGHYTAFIASRGGWLYCDDSRVTQADPKDVVGKPAYILFYKRVKA